MRTTAMRIMGLLFLRSRLTDDTLMGAQITLFQATGDDTQSMDGKVLRRTIKLSLLYWNA